MTISSERPPFKFIVEHLEEELDEWSTLEYLNISSHVGPNNLVLTHVPEALSSNLPPRIASAPIRVSGENILQMTEGETPEFSFDEVLLLDPASPIPLSPSDAFKYSCLVFGGILGDDPPKDRTKELRVFGFASRHLGPVQMTTDTAVLVSQKVLKHQIPLEDLPFTDRPTITLGKKESVEMPFRYLVDPVNGGPKMPPGMLQLLRDSNDISLN